MTWESALMVVAGAATLTVGIVVLWAYGHLRRSFHEQTLRQLRHAKRAVEMAEQLRVQLEEANARIQLLTEQSGRLTRAVTGLLEKEGEDSERPADPPQPNRLLH